MGARFGFRCFAILLRLKDQPSPSLVRAFIGFADSPLPQTLSERTTRPTSRPVVPCRCFLRDSAPLAGAKTRINSCGIARCDSVCPKLEKLLIQLSFPAPLTIKEAVNTETTHLGISAKVKSGVERRSTGKDWRLRQWQRPLTPKSCP